MQCAQDPPYWLQNYTATENPQYQQKGLPFRAPFPEEGLFRAALRLFEAFAKWPHLFIPKSRDMMTSWAVMGYSAHRGQWFKEETIVQTHSENKAGVS